MPQQASKVITMLPAGKSAFIVEWQITAQISVTAFKNMWEILKVWKMTLKYTVNQNNTDEDAHTLKH